MAFAYSHPACSRGDIVTVIAKATSGPSSRGPVAHLAITVRDQIGATG